MNQLNITSIIACLALMISFVNLIITILNFSNNRSKISATIYRKRMISQGCYEFVIEIKNTGNLPEIILKLNVIYYKNESGPLFDQIYNLTIPAKDVKQVTIELSTTTIRIIKQLNIIYGKDKITKVKKLKTNMKIF
jgi:hypothetical protein